MFLPVWMLYTATFPLSFLGVELGGGAPLVIRGLVVFGGFGLAALWQVVLATLVSEVVVSD